MTEEIKQKVKDELEKVKYENSLANIELGEGITRMVIAGFNIIIDEMEKTK